MTEEKGRKHETKSNGKVDLNEKIKCFLCSVEPHAQKFSLRYICRYLRINLKQVLFTSQQSNVHGLNENIERLLEKEKIPGFPAALCNSCASIIIPLSRLCMDLELLQMKVNHGLERIREVIQNSGAPDHNSVSHISNIKIHRQAIEEYHPEFTKLLRKTMKTKCEKHLSRLVPIVKLVNYSSVLNAGIKFLDKISPSEITAVVPTSSPSSFPPSSVGTKDKPENSQSPLIESGSALEIRKRSKSNPFRKRMTCNLCDPPRNMMANLIPRHKMEKHIENWFLSSKLPHLTTSDFKKYCEHVVKVELLSCRNFEDSERIPRGKCSMCSFVTISEPIIRRLRLHIGVVHKEILTNKLVQLQRSTTFDELAETNFDKLENSKLLVTSGAMEIPKTCNLCDPPRKLSSGALSRHKIMRHAENWFLSSKLPHLSIGDFKRYCARVVKIELQSCKRFNDSKGIAREKCSFCLYTSNQQDTQRLRYHICSIHKDVLAEKLLDLQRSTTVDQLAESESSRLRKRPAKCTVCGHVFSYRENLSRHKKLKCHMFKNKCKDCGMLFKHSGGLRQHNKSKHGKGNPRIRPPTICDICGEVFNHARNIHRHKRIKHGDHVSDSHVSDSHVDDNNSKSSKRLLRHQRRVHQQDKEIPGGTITKKKDQNAEPHHETDAPTMHNEFLYNDHPSIPKLEPCTDTSVLGDWNDNHNDIVQIDRNGDILDTEEVHNNAVNNDEVDYHFVDSEIDIKIEPSS